MIQTIERFNQQAVKHNLSAGAILLWQHLFLAMNRKGQFKNVQQHTSVLMASLQVSSQGLFKMRQTLIDKGFLAVSHDEHQYIYYTLMINGKVIGEKGDSREEKGKLGDITGGRRSAAPYTKIHELSLVGVADHCDPSGVARYNGELRFSESVKSQPSAQKSTPSADIILTNRYRQYIDAFCDKFGPAPKANLLQWADMRRKNGWTLTLWGLEVVLRNLVELSAGDAMQMANIAAQSVKRRWKGFFALKTKAQPSGEKLLMQEQKQQRQNGYGSRFKNAVTQKFAPEGRDLSFLVV